PALARHEYRSAEGFASRMLEDDIGVFAAGEFPDFLAEAPPLAGILSGVVFPESIVFGTPVDDEIGAHGTDDIGLLRRRNHADRYCAAVDRHLRGIRTQSARRAPDQHHIALFHIGAVARHQ